MDFELLDKYLTRPDLNRNCILFFLILSLFAVAYFLLIMPINHLNDREEIANKLIFDDIAKLDAKILEYPAIQILENQETHLNHSLKKIDLIPVEDLVRSVSTQLVHQQLSLIDLSSTNINSHELLHFKIEGDYYHIIQFIQQLSQQEWRISIKNLSILRRDQQLFLLLDITQ